MTNHILKHCSLTKWVLNMFDIIIGISDGIFMMINVF